MSTVIDLRSDTVTGRRPACAPPWPPPRSATTSSAKTRPSTASKSASPSCSARRRPCSCRRAPCRTRSRVKAHTQPGDELLCDVNLPHLQLRGRRPGRPQRRHLPHARRRVRHPRREPARGQDPARQRSTWSAPGWSAWRTRTTAAAAASIRSRRSRRSAPGRASTA